MMSDRFLATPEQTEGRKDIDQALSLLQLSGGSSTQVKTLVGTKNWLKVLVGTKILVGYTGWN